MLSLLISYTLFFKVYFIEVWLIYNAMQVSYVQQSDSAMYIFFLFFKFLPCCVVFHHTAMHTSHNYTYISSLPSLPSLLSPPLIPALQVITAPYWTSCATQQLFTSYPSYTWLCVYIDGTFSIYPILPPLEQKISVCMETQKTLKSQSNLEKEK